MKVFICCAGHIYEGYSPPAVVFSRKEDAEAWRDFHTTHVDENGYPLVHHDFIDIFEMEVTQMFGVKHDD